MRRRSSLPPAGVKRSTLAAGQHRPGGRKRRRLGQRSPQGPCTEQDGRGPGGPCSLRRKPASGPGAASLRRPPESQIGSNWTSPGPITGSERRFALMGQPCLKCSPHPGGPKRGPSGAQWKKPDPWSEDCHVRHPPRGQTPLRSPRDAPTGNVGRRASLFGKCLCGCN